MWQSLSITKKIWFSLGILVTGYLASMLFGFHFGRQTENRLTDVSAALFPAAMKSRHAVSVFTEQKKLYYDAVMLGEQSFLLNAHNKFKESENDLQSIVELKGLKPEKIEMAEDIINRMTKYTTAAGTVYASMILYFSDTTDITDEQIALNNEKVTSLDKQGGVLHSRLNSFADSFAEDLKMEIASINRTTRQQRYMNIIIFFAVVITALSLIAIIISRSIVRPLEKTFMLENAVKQSIDGIAVADPKDGALTFFNTTWAEMFGYKKGELSEVHMTFFHTEEQIQDEIPVLKESLVKTGAYTGEMNFKRKNDSVFPALVTASVLKDETGEVQSFLFSVKDITEEKKAEEEIIRITQAVENSSDAIGISDIHGNHFYQNPAFTALYGYELDDFKTGRKHLSDFATDKNNYKKVSGTIRNGDTWLGEIEMSSEDGHLFYVMMRASEIKDKEGKTIGYASVHTDITKRKKAEEELIRINQAVESSSDAIGMADPMGNHFYQNASFTKLFNYELEEFIQGLHPSILYADEQVGKDVFSTIMGGDLWSGEIEMVKKDGHKFPVLLRANAIKDNEGNTIGLVGTHTDITELKRAEEALRMAETKMRSILENSPDYILNIDPLLNIQFLNRPFHNQSVEDAIGEPIINFIHPKYHDEYQALIKQVFETGEEKIMVGETLLSDGASFWCENRFGAVEHNGSVSEIVLTATDITERKKAEAELAAAQKELVEKAHQAGMADIATGTLHNVGNILNSVKTSAQIIGDLLGASSISGFQKANNMLRENIDRIDDFLINNPKGKMLMQYYLKLEDGFNAEHNRTMKHITRLMDKVDAIVDVIAAQQSYAGSGGLTETYNLSDVVEDALTMQSGSTTRYGISIVKKFHDTPQVPIQKTKLVHILINLIKNAKESMMEIQQQQRKLAVSIDSNNDAIFVKINDTGSGIALDDLEKIFSHGFTTKQDGHGFGLHSSANYMKEMGGRMWAESEGEGKGATFILRFPHPDAA